MGGNGETPELAQLSFGVPALAPFTFKYRPWCTYAGAAVAGTTAALLVALCLLMLRHDRGRSLVAWERQLRRDD